MSLAWVTTVSLSAIVCCVVVVVTAALHCWIFMPVQGPVLTGNSMHLTYYWVHTKVSDILKNLTYCFSILNSMLLWNFGCSQALLVILKSGTLCVVVFTTHTAALQNLIGPVTHRTGIWWNLWVIFSPISLEMCQSQILTQRMSPSLKTGVWRERAQK